MGQPKPPAPNPKRDLAQATKTYLKFLPQIIGAEDVYRGIGDAKSLGVSDAQFAGMSEDQKRIAAQQHLQTQYGPEQYREQLAALGQLDPQGTALRQQLGTSLQQNLGTGYEAPAGLQQAVASQYLGRQVAGGNVFGNAAATGADIYAGNAANQWYQQNVANTQRFLQGPTPEQQLLAVQPVAPDRSSAYVNPAAPAQAAQNTYANYLAQYQAAGSGQGGAGQGIGSTIGGIAGGLIGSYYGGPVGGSLGSTAGSATGGYVGGLFSDHRLKDHIEYVGQSPSGLPIYRFNYKDRSGRYEGTVAQHLMHLRPDAVKVDKTGYMKVLYDKIDIDFKEVV